MKFCKIIVIVFIYVVLPFFLPVYANENFFLPLFYIPKNVIYSNMGTDDLPEIFSFKFYDVRSAFYLDKLGDATGVGADGILLRVTPRGTVTEETIDTYWARENINQPFVLQKPEGVFYNLSLFFDGVGKEKLKDSPEMSLEAHLNYATKRISEIEKYKIADLNLLQNYDKEMNEAFNDLEKLKTIKDKKFPLWLKRFKETISNHRVRADNLFSNGGYSSAEEDYLRNLFAQYAKKITTFGPSVDFSFQIYDFKIPKTGEYKLFTKENENKWSGSNLRSFNSGDNSLKIPIMTTPKNLIGPGLRINDYLPNYPYKISFDYQQNSGNGSLSVIEGDTATPLTKSLPSTGKKFEFAEFFFFSSPKGGKAKVRLSVGESKNLRVEKISQPEIMLENNSDNENKIPKITFRRINSTKYSAKIEGADAPYHLVFSENFHKDWKLYLSKDDSVGNDIIANYFVDAIKEGRHKNVFLEKDIFQTWFRKPIAENSHFKINGFANSWYITPQDVNGVKNYELIVEFWPQRLYYLGFIISLLTLFVCWIIIGMMVFKKK